MATIVTAPRVVIVASSGVIIVEIAVQVPQRVMIGSVLRSAVEPPLVSTFVSSGNSRWNVLCCQ